VLAVSLAATGVLPAAVSHAATAQPNILFVLTDDLDAAEMPWLPKLEALIAQHGVTFGNEFVSDSLCCPSRTSTLRGQFAHNTGVQSNSGVNGGFNTAHRLGIESDTIATRLQAAGYRTGLFGKYLNGYPGSAGRTYVPPGWNEWASPVDGRPYGEYAYTLNHKGRFPAFGTTPRDYGTDVYLRMAQRFIGRAARAGRPFFAYLSVFAPHEPATPAPADVGRFAGARAPRTPSYDQAEVSAMPVYIRHLPPFTPDEMHAIDALYERRIESLRAVDRGVAHLMATLRALHELHNTYVVFTSDNGFHLGQHRLPAGKETPYDTDTHVPLVIRGPGIKPNTTVDEMTANTDLAPTFAAMAGAPRARYWDGHSLLRLARGDEDGARRRRVQLVEHWTERSSNRPVAPGVFEPPDVDQSDPALHPTAMSGPDALSDHTIYGRLVRIPDYAGLRTDRYLYVEYVNGDRELYDLATDRDEMHNLAGTAPALEAVLAARLEALRACSRSACNTLERGDPVDSGTGTGAVGTAELSR
jgi:N-acetylglucosamine-6-sulfatase